MKKFIVALLGLGMITAPVMSQVKFGVEAGMNASQVISSKYAEGNGRVSGFQVGGTVDYQFSKHWVLMSGLSFVQKGGELNQNLFVSGGNGSYFLLGAPNFDRISLKMNYLELPVKMGFSIRINDHVNLIPSAGLYVSYGFNAGSCSLNAYKDVRDSRGYFTPVKWKPFDGYNDPTYSKTPLNKLEHLDFGGVVGLKAVVSDHFTASFNYSHSIKAIQKQMDLRNSSFQLSVGYRF